jgi:hypothetical protein
MNATIQIAQVLNVSPNQIKSVREMAWVYCVVVFGQRATFVSKKKVEALTMEKSLTFTAGQAGMNGKVYSYFGGEDIDSSPVCVGYAGASGDKQCFYVWLRDQDKEYFCYDGILEPTLKKLGLALVDARGESVLTFEQAFNAYAQD